MSSLADTIKRMMDARPAEPPKKGLAALLSSGGGLDIRSLARKNMEATGRIEVEVETKAAPKPSLFRKISAPPKKVQTPEKKENVKKLSLRLLEEMGLEAAPLDRASKLGQAFRREGVSESPELNRIIALPRRPADLDSFPNLTEQFRKPGGTMKLWPVQSACLHDAKQAWGLLALAGAGHGKTLVSLLVGDAIGAKRIVLLIPPQLRVQLMQNNIPALNKHWRLPLDRLHVVAYSELSSAKSADVLEELKPDLIVADECHLLRHRSSARTKRFLRYMKDHPECRFVGLSGTITRRSLKDYGHLAELALRNRSPLPHNYHTLNEWAEAIDVSKDPIAPGALVKLCDENERRQLAETSETFAQQNVIRGAFRRRLVETSGVVATEEGAIGTSLVLGGLRPLVPAEVQKALDTLRLKWEIGADELVDILSVIRVGCQLAAGFYYRFVWPDGIPDREWLDARSTWNKELREILKRSRKGLDSPLLVTNAILRGEFESDAYQAWAAVKDRYRPEPPRETVWLSDYLVQASVQWARETCDKSNPGIIWVSWRALGEKIAAASGFPYFFGGDKAAEQIAALNVKKTPVVILSVKAHGTGLNLQDFSRNLFTAPVGAVEMEQALARTHRPGQLADEVAADVFVHTDEMANTFRSSLRDARYIETSQGNRQKLLYATRVNLPEEE